MPDDELSLAIGREGQNARLAARLTGWRIDIKSETEFAEEEAEAAFSGSEGDDEVGGRCAALLSSGKRCPNSALPGSRYCGIPAHRELAAAEAEEADRLSDPIRTCVGCGRRAPQPTLVRFARRRRRARRRLAARRGARTSAAARIVRPQGARDAAARCTARCARA